VNLSNIRYLTCPVSWVSIARPTVVFPAWTPPGNARPPETWILFFGNFTPIDQPSGLVCAEAEV